MRESIFENERVDEIIKDILENKLHESIKNHSYSDVIKGQIGDILKEYFYPEFKLIDPKSGKVTNPKGCRPKVKKVPHKKNVYVLENPHPRNMGSRHHLFYLELAILFSFNEFKYLEILGITSKEE